VSDLAETPDRFEPLLRDVNHKAKSTAKYRLFEDYLAEVLNFRATDIYTAYVSKRDNFEVRMTQSPRARRAQLRVGLLPSESLLTQVVDVATRFVLTKYPGSAVLLVCDTRDGWVPRWGVEPETVGESPDSHGSLSRFSAWRGDFELRRYPYRSPGRQTGLLELFDSLVDQMRDSRTYYQPPLLEFAQHVRADPDTLLRFAEVLYRRDPGLLTSLIETDVTAHDVVAIAHRKAVVERFRLLLEDEEFFSATLAESGRTEEGVWQNLLEENPWILGASLTGQLLTSWNAEKLEQVVAGFSVSGPGRRTDALMHTSGRIRALVFAEIKHHRTHLLGAEYRRGVWAPSAELAGGVTQVQRTIQFAARQIGEFLAETDESGAETGEHTYLVRPRSFLIIGNLKDLRGQGGVHREKYESFELYRRNLYEPEVITFDELLARAEWHVEILDEGSGVLVDADTDVDIADEVIDPEIVDDESES